LVVPIPAFSNYTQVKHLLQRAMCSTEEDKDEMIRGRKPRPASSCCKCDSPPFVRIRRGDPFCKSCFDTFVLHKFRQGLGKTKILYPDERVVLDLSGNLPSMTMLQLMSSAYDKAAHKKMTAVPLGVIIDESNLYDVGESVVPSVLRTIKSCTDMPIITFIVPYEMILLEDFESRLGQFYAQHTNDDVVDFNEVTDISDLTAKARLLLSNVDNLTAREDLHTSLRMQLLYRMAKVLNSCKIMLTQTSVELASHLLTTISVGKGSSIPFETSYLDKRMADVTFINCMRDFTPKECAYYLKLKGVTPLTVIQPGTLCDPYVGSISRLTSTFVSGLQQDFPSTVSTILRTGNKLGATRGKASCMICLVPLTSGKYREGDEYCNGCMISLSEAKRSVDLLPAFTKRCTEESVLNEFLIDETDR